MVATMQCGVEGLFTGFDDSFCSAGSKMLGVCGERCLSMIELQIAMKEDALSQRHFLNLLSNRLNEIVSANDDYQKTPCLPQYEGPKVLISASEYVDRILKYGEVSECCILVAIIYLERLKQQEHNLFLTSTSIQRLFLVSVMLAGKFLEDMYCSNKWWAQIGSIDVHELNVLEIDFLSRLNFNLFVKKEEYDALLNSLSWSQIQEDSAEQKSSESVEPVECRCGSSTASSEADSSDGASSSLKSLCDVETVTPPWIPAPPVGSGPFIQLCVV